MLSIVTLGFLAVVLVLVWRRWSYKNTYQSLYSLPSPPRHWLLGNIPELLTAVKERKYFKLLFNWSQELGPMYAYWIGSTPYLALTKPKVIEETIVNGMKDGSLIRTPRTTNAWNDMAGPILIGQDGKEWQWRRKAWNPEFNSKGIAQYIDIVDQTCTQVIEKIKETPSGEVVCVDPLFVELTMRVICCLVLGIPVDPKLSSHEGPPLEVKKIYDAMSVITYRFLRVATGEQRWKKYLPTQSARDYWSARQCFESFLGPRIDLAIQLRDNSVEKGLEISSEFKKSMLVKIAAKEPNYNRENLISEMIELLIAGTDTTAHTLSFAMGELVLNPQVMEKARSIVDKTDNWKELEYIRAIVKEILRLYGIASGSSSIQASRDTVVEGIRIPRGARVYWSMWAAGRDPETYNQPEEFLPERWLQEDKESKELPLIQFGSGYHRCLGEHLAMLEATMMLTKLLRNFEWELVNGRSSLENIQQNLLIYPSDRMPLRFQSR